MLTQLAEEYSIAILGVHHFSKAKRDHAGDAISGSHAYRDAARAVWLFALDSDDCERRLMVADKHNWAEQRPTGVAYRIEQGRISYEAEPLDLSSDELMNQATSKPIDVAIAWLLTRLAAGPQPAVDIQAAAALESISDRTLSRAKLKVGIDSFRENNRWWWRLPEQHGQPS